MQGAWPPFPFADTVKVPEECEIAVRRKDDREYLFVLNFSGQTQKITLEKTATDLDSGEKAEGEITLPAYGTKVYQL